MRYDFGGSKKRGCPTCGGIDPKPCMRCRGKTRLCDWENKDDFPLPVKNTEQQVQADSPQAITSEHPHASMLFDL